MVPLTPQSTGGSTVDSRYPIITSPRPLEKKWKKKREKGLESDFGTPLYRWSSEGDPTPNKKGRVAEMREAASEGAKGRDGRPRSRSANGTRLLNGRVYGAKRYNNANPFANVRSEEPKFVEWGFGGMGSVQSSGVGANIWSKVQSSGGVSIGAHEETTARSRASSAGDDDDGSGMAWVKKRRARKEQEQQKPEQTTSTAVETPPATEPHASGSDLDPPAGKEDTALGQELSASPTQINAPLPEGRSTPTSEQRLLQAVTLPPAHHHHHRGHSHSTLERLSSAIKIETERRDSEDTVRDPRTPPAQEQEESRAEVTGQPDEARARADSVSSKASEESSSSSSEGNDADADAEADEEDLESPRSGEEEDEEDIDEELEERARLTAVGAGVEKISRHKESTPVPEAGPE
ncbi:hypothetical protein EVJ58_g5465 [Rhodofomes roseus]|uniref:Uncharacterized protein n=1 Tax=Rhodofomes roseus TaxID=34475 RepID=A0A4Y9YDG7_9APHY|nr:hypothetical protein EVJ58_g5465 [Rhodofomes roseus]